MQGTTFITFREYEDVAVDYHVLSDGDTPGCEVEWSFDDTRIANDVIVTTDEEEAIILHIISVADDADGPDIDRV